MKKKVIKAVALICMTMLIGWWFYEARGFTEFQEDSEFLVMYSLECVEQDWANQDTGFALGTWTEEDGVKTFVPYKSQVGLQGTVFRSLIPIVGEGHRSAYKKLCSVAAAGVLCLIAWQLNKRYGLLMGGTFLFVSVANQWTTLFAGNMYWVMATWFLPLLLSLLYLNSPRRWRPLVYAGYFAAILIKCLCGYEFVTSIMLMGICLPAAEWLARPSVEKFRGLVLIGVCSLLGFFAAYGIHSWIMGNGDLMEGARQIYEEVVKRRITNNPTGFDGAIAESMQASVLQTVLLYFKVQPTGTIASVLLVAGLGCLGWQAFAWKQDVKLEAAMFFVSFLAPMSWFVLAKAHSYIHTHINFVLWYLGWMQIAVYLCAKFFLEAYRRAGQE